LTIPCFSGESHDALPRAWIDTHMADDIRIAGRKTVRDWKQFRTALAPGVGPDLWEDAFRVYFEARLSSRYLRPIETLQASRTLDGEGFSILAIHCTLIEFLESTLQGLSYRYVRRKDPPLRQYEYSESGKLFAAFLSTRQPFCKVFDPAIAADFYVGVRCALLHEARTKNGWIIKAKGPAIADVSAKNKIVYRNNFHAALLEFIQSYRMALPADGVAGSFRS